jgi:hypothetical protein
VRDTGESAFGAQELYVIDASGRLVTSVTTDATGVWNVPSIATGTYRVSFDASSWWALRKDWIPSTTSSLSFEVSTSVSDGSTATADLGLRRIQRSTDLNSPVSSATSSTGLRALSYDDAVPARDLVATLESGGSLGPAAATTTVYFDYGTQITNCVTSVSGTKGGYSNFSSKVWVDYLSWLDNGDEVLWHEYGHAWTHYADKIVQQDGTFSSYLSARGVSGDPRILSSKAWDPSEMAAEDYRELFGSANAAPYSQMNTDLPRAEAVSGLRTFFEQTYAGGQGTSPTPSPSPTPTSTPSPTPTANPTPTPTPTSTATSTPTSTPTPAQPLVVTSPAVSPQPVNKTAAISSGVNEAASVTVQVLDSKGKVIKTLLANASRPAGSFSVSWDRRTDTGSRAKAGTYTVKVSGLSTDGSAATATAPAVLG